MTTWYELEIKDLRERLWAEANKTDRLEAQIVGLKADLASANDRAEAMAGECLKLQGIAIERDREHALAEKRRMELSELESIAVIKGYRGEFGLKELQEWLDEPEEVTNG